MSRPITLTDQNRNVEVSGVTYNPANQLLSINYFTQGESRVYNSLGQLTQLSSTGVASINYSYNFPAGANNGKISSSYNAMTGETIAYQYDSLNRLISAAGSGWGDAYGFDGFGNLLSKTVTAGSAPTLSTAVNSANNQIVGLGYDANGNQATPPNNSGELGYDSENRLIENGVSVQYAYDSQNKRVWAGTVVSGSLTSQSANLYGIDGQLLGSYSLSVSSTEITDAATSLSVYFAGRRVGIVSGGGTMAFVQDRLGSNMSWPIHFDFISLYPWGEDRGTPAPNDQIKFATYTRDSATLLDYADQRYYSNQYGRFVTPDPSTSSQDLKAPQSWNRYPYVLGDPVNGNDPSGLLLEGPCDPIFGCDDGGGGGGGNGGNPCVGADGFTPMPGPGCSGQGGPPPTVPETPVPQVNCDQQLADSINALLTSKNSPLAGYSAWFVAVGLMNDIDPRLLAAMSGAESGFGTSHVATADNNAFGILHKVGQSYVPVVYPNFGANISAAGNIVESQVYNRGNDTVNLLYSGQPGAYCQDSPGFPCSKGASNVTKFLVGMGGNPNDLAFPCPF